MKNQNVPYHLAVVLDGNRRWAKERGFSSSKGHLEGYKNLINLCWWCKNRGVKVLTAFVFSTENWKRTEKEVSYLMRLFEKGLSSKRTLNRLYKEGIRVRIIGQKKKLPESLQKIITKIESLTKNNKKLQMNLALSYGGRWDILQAIQKIVNKKFLASEITNDLIEKNLLTANLIEPDLIIRTGGEQRLSNFLLWQAAYSELYFSKKYWPAFTEQDLNQAFKDYAYRQKRFGK